MHFRAIAPSDRARRNLLGMELREGPQTVSHLMAHTLFNLSRTVEETYVKWDVSSSLVTFVILAGMVNIQNTEQPIWYKMSWRSSEKQKED